MRIDTETTSIAGAGRGRPELRLSHRSGRGTYGRRGITQVAGCFIRCGCRGCERLTSGSDSFGVDMANVVWMGTGLESALNDECRGKCINPIGFLLLFRELGANVSHQRLRTGMHVFIVVLSKDFLLYQRRILCLLGERRREKRHLHR